jgi:L-alanine-DL-glutamate epimerase-like enolase superfamily enzyme
MSDTTIARVHAGCYQVPVSLPHLAEGARPTCVIVEVESSDGAIGHGLAGGPHGMARTVREFINGDLGPFLTGFPATRPARVWEDAFRVYNPRVLGGVWSMGVSAIDIALWDLKGKVLGSSITDLLGGAHDRVPVYVTFGDKHYTIDELQTVAREMVAAGHRRLKMVVGTSAPAPRADQPVPRYDAAADIAHDVRRVRAVREAIGDEVELLIDANYTFTLSEAKSLARRVEDQAITWFEEPVRGNDPRLLADLRRSTSIAIAAGQMLSNVWEHKRLIEADAVDHPHPNVVHVGGYTEAVRVAALARAFNLDIGHGGGWPMHNLHLQAGVINGGLVELRLDHWRASELLFGQALTIEDGYAVPPPGPGAGLVLAESAHEYLVT